VTTEIRARAAIHRIDVVAYRAGSSVCQQRVVARATSKTVTVRRVVVVGGGVGWAGQHSMVACVRAPRTHSSRARIHIHITRTHARVRRWGVTVVGWRSGPRRGVRREEGWEGAGVGRGESHNQHGSRAPPHALRGCSSIDACVRPTRRARAPTAPHARHDEASVRTQSPVLPERIGRWCDAVSRTRHAPQRTSRTPKQPRPTSPRTTQHPHTHSHRHVGGHWTTSEGGPGSPPHGRGGAPHTTPSHQTPLAATSDHAGVLRTVWGEGRTRSHSHHARRPRASARPSCASA